MKFHDDTAPKHPLSLQFSLRYHASLVISPKKCFKFSNFSKYLGLYYQKYQIFNAILHLKGTKRYFDSYPSCYIFILARSEQTSQNVCLPPTPSFFLILHISCAVMNKTIDFRADKTINYPHYTCLCNFSTTLHC